MPIDILAGSATLREQIEQQVPIEDIAASWRQGVKDFEDARQTVSALLRLSGAPGQHEGACFPSQTTTRALRRPS